MYKCNMLFVSVVLTTIFCCWTTASTNEQGSDKTNNISLMRDNKDDVGKTSARGDGKFFNYLRLPDGECHNCSTYKCTNQKTNMGGSEWCIMLFPDALTHCDADPNCGGYTMTTAEWFHKKYDKNGHIAVHLAKVGQKSVPCLLSEWSSYDKQKAIRESPVTYGRSTCDNSGTENTCDKSQNFNYVFVSNSDVVSGDVPYSCKNHPNNLGNKDSNCILPMVDGVTLCNSDAQCEGFLINTDDNWQTKFLNNGMQGVQLFGQGVTYTPSQTWRSFRKQQ